MVRPHCRVCVYSQFADFVVAAALAGFVAVVAASAATKAIASAEAELGSTFQDQATKCVRLAANSGGNRQARPVQASGRSMGQMAATSFLKRNDRPRPEIETSEVRKTEDACKASNFEAKEPNTLEEGQTCEHIV